MALRTICDIASDVVTADPDATARDLATKMRDEGVGSVVVAVDSRPIGIVTDRDLTVEVLATGADGTAAVARELMTEQPVTVRANRGVSAVVRTMDDHGVRRIPIVDGGDVLVGIVTLDDVYRELVAEHDRLAAVVAAESPD